MAVADPGGRHAARRTRRRSIRRRLPAWSMTSISIPATKCRPERCCCGSSRTMISPNCSSWKRPPNSPSKPTSATRSNSPRRRSVRRLSTRDVSTLKSARAQVAAQQALIEEKIVKAPFAGRLGIRQVDLGQYLAAGTTGRHAAGARPHSDRFLPASTGARAHQSRPDATAATVDTYPGVTLQRSRSSRSTPRSTTRAATFRCAPRSTMPTGGWCPACSPTSRSMRATRAAEITLPQTDHHL